MNNQPTQNLLPDFVIPDLHLFEYFRIGGTRPGSIRYKETQISKGNLDLQFLQDLWIKQKGRCLIGGNLLYIKRGGKWAKGIRTWDKASIDRIDNNKLYTEDNVQFLSLTMNYAKNRDDMEGFSEYMKQIAPFNLRTPNV